MGASIVVCVVTIRSRSDSLARAALSCPLASYSWSPSLLIARNSYFHYGDDDDNDYDDYDGDVDVDGDDDDDDDDEGSG